MRTREEQVTFTRPFKVAASDTTQPAGTYLVVTEEEPREVGNHMAYLRTATLLRIPANPSPGQTVQLVPFESEEMAAALAAVAEVPVANLQEKQPQLLVIRDIECERTSISVTLRHGVWQVLRNRIFYGDYLDQRDALAAANRLMTAAQSVKDR